MTSHSTDWRSTLERLWAELPVPKTTDGVGQLASADLLMPTAAGTLRLAVDGQGRRHLLVAYPNDQVIPRDLRSGGIALEGRTLLLDGRPVQFADLKCVDADLNSVFSTFIVVVLELFSTGIEISPQRLQDLLASWRKLLAGRTAGWTPSRAGGLFSELVVLERLLLLDPSAAAAWRGPFGEAQDFRRRNEALEVKSTLSQEGRVVSIHGLDQLAAPVAGTLGFGWMRLVVGDPGRTVDELASSCRSKAADPMAVDDAFGVLGWSLAPEDVHELRFAPVEERWYQVAETFPKITNATLAAGGPPAGVSAVEYRVDLDYVLEDPAGLEAVLANFLELA